VKVDARTWSKANLWRHPSGELCVRPGLRRIYTPESGRKLVGGFSVPNSYTQEVWHYVFDVATTGALSLKLRVLDETFQTVQVLATNVDVIPRVITHAVVEGMGLICSPDLPTLFFVVGSGTIFADAVDSDVSTSSVLPVPRGICTAWCNRVVVCDGRSMFVSDPVAATGGDVRTFVGLNQQQRPGVIYGVHEARDGDLVVVTSAGVYALAADATAEPVVGGAIWRLVNHNIAASFASSCVVRGRVYGLTRDGWALIDTETTAETALAEPLMPRAVFGRVSLEDFRSARLYATDEGPLVAHDGLNAVHRTDVGSGIASWWRSSFAADNFRVRGTLRELDGTERLLCENGIFAICGDFDGEIALTTEVAAVKGLLFAPIPPDPDEPRLVRHVDVAAAVGGTTSNLGVSLRGSRKAAALEPDSNGYTVGVSTWTQAGRRLTTTPLSSMRVDFGAAAVERTDDVAIEVEATGCLNRISDKLAVDFAKSASGRPGKVI
jgi:hypothetical protein